MSMNGSDEKPMRILVEYNGRFVSLGERFREITSGRYSNRPGDVDLDSWLGRSAEILD